MGPDDAPGTAGLAPLAGAAAGASERRVFRSRSPSPDREHAESEGYAAPRRCRISGQHVAKVDEIRRMTACVKKPASFTIEAYDVNGNRRKEGGDPFMVSIRGGSLVRARCEDLGNGTYTISYLPSVSGSYTVAVSLYGTPITGSPFPLTVLSPIPDPLRCKVHGAGLSSAVAREPTSFEIEFIDTFGVITRAEELDCYVELIGDSVPPSQFEPIDDAADAPTSSAGKAASSKVEFASQKTKRNAASAPSGSSSAADSQSSRPSAAAPATSPIMLEIPETGTDAGASSDARSDGGTERSAVDIADTANAEPSLGYGTKSMPLYEDDAEEGFHSFDAHLLRWAPAGSSLNVKSGRESGPPRVGTHRSQGTSRSTQSPKGSHRRRDPYGINPHGRRPGTAGPVTQRFRLDAGERQQHMTLWSRRLSTEGVSQTKPLSTALGSRTKQDIQNGQLHSARRGQVIGAGGPSYAHELDDDPHGVAFAYGGVDPGTLHAAGKIVKVHSVHYSIGRAGVYRLHVGLRQQSCMLKGSPFELHVKPGVAHHSASRLLAEDLPLQGIVGKVSKGVRLVTHDRMSNRCLVGGAPVQVSCSSNKVSTNIIDKGDGTYLINWHSDSSGKYTLNVTVEGSAVGGSPVPLTMFASSPQVSKFQVTGTGLEKAVAGKPAVFRIESQDDFGNLCDLSQLTRIEYGIAIVQTGMDEAANKKKVKAERDKEGKADGTAGTKNSRNSDPNASMPFQGSWVNGLYEISYVAQKAGTFSLHVWCNPDGRERERLPGSPFNLSVSEGQANASGCFIKGADALRELQQTEGPSPAGQEISLHPQLRDQFGNASSASEGALTASLEGPFTGESELPVRSLPSGLGTYEVGYTPELQGDYVLHIRLHGTAISDSPVRFSVMCGVPNGTKSRLLPVTEPLFVGQPIGIVLEAVDKFGNKIDRGGANVGARAAGNAASACTVDDNQDGTYTIRFTQNAAGDCKVIARIDNMELAPMLVTIISKDGKGTKERPQAAVGAPSSSPDLDVRDPNLRLAPAATDSQRSGNAKVHGTTSTSSQGSQRHGSQQSSRQSTQRSSKQSSHRGATGFGGSRRTPPSSAQSSYASAAAADKGLRSVSE